MPVIVLDLSKYDICQIGWGGLVYEINSVWFERLFSECYEL